MKFAVVRPEPGNARTAAALARFGPVLRLPLFAVVPVAWTVPDPAGFDALLLTSAQAVRQAGDGLARLAALPVLAVGEATAAAARAAGLTVAMTGTRDAAALRQAADAAGFVRLLHLAGRDRIAGGGTAITVYDARPLAVPPGAIRACEGATVLLHSPRAARVFADLATRDGAARARIAIAAISAAAADAAGSGWRATGVAAAPDDAALIDAAVALD